MSVVPHLRDPYHGVMSARSNVQPLEPAIIDALSSQTAPVMSGTGHDSSHATTYSPADHVVLQAQSHLPSSLAYANRNVLAHRGQTFGIEIEVEGVSGDEIAHALFNAGLSTFMDQRPYHELRDPSNDWVVENDTSVDGAEVISPILHDTPATWGALSKVCSILRDLGATTSIRTGFHVHVGTASSGIENSPNAFRKIGRLCTYGEDLLFRISGTTPDGDDVLHRGAFTGYNWCTPVDADALNAHGDARFEEHTDVSISAKPVLRLSGRYATLEYRYFDGTIDPNRIQQYIKLCCAITSRAGEIDESVLPDSIHPLGEQYGAQSSGHSAAADDVLATFAALVFPNPKDRRGLYSLYARGTWQPGISQALERIHAKESRIEAARRELVTMCTELFSAIAHRDPTAQEQQWLSHMVTPSYTRPFPLPSQECDEVHDAFLGQKHAFIEQLDLLPSERREFRAAIDQEADRYAGEKAEWTTWSQHLAQFSMRSGRLPSEEESRWLRSQMRAALTISAPPSRQIAAHFLDWCAQTLPDDHPQRPAWERNRAYRAELVRGYMERTSQPSAPSPSTNINALS